MGKLSDEIEYEEVQIFDNIHGFIRITKAEKDIINSLYFQRLRDLKQLGLGYYMFPGAVHTRFAHSIGVLAVMDRILSRICEKSKELITVEDIKRLRMAALLHDIGHYPLSHTIESVYKEYHKDLLLTISSEDEEGGHTKERHIDAKLEKEINERIKEAHHEELGGYIIRNTTFEGGVTYILKSNDFTDEDIDIISKTIVGKAPVVWYNQVMHSDLDADRLDYLLRDSASTGVKFGGFDFDYIINNCKLAKDDKNETIFVIQSRACFTIEHFLMTRYYWYAKIIFEKTLAVFDKMVKDVYGWLLENHKIQDFIDVLDTVNEPLEFMFFNDFYFWEKIKWIVTSEEVEELPNYMHYRKIAEMILKREPLKKIGGGIKRIPKCLECKCECSDTALKEYFSTIENKDEVAACMEEESKGIEISSKVDICKRMCELKEEAALTEPIKILDKNKEITMISQQGYTILEELSRYKLTIERFYEM